MLKDCIAYRVFIGAPGDCESESRAVYQSILEWNARYTPMTHRVMLPIHWTLQMIPMGGNDPQELINEKLLESSDLLIAIFKSQLGSTRGTEREVRFFIEKGRARQSMLFVHRDESLREPALREFVNDMRSTMFYKSFVDERELVEHVGQALSDKAMRSHAAPHIKRLRTALFLRLREWGTLDRTATLLEQAFVTLCLSAEALTDFSRREAGLDIGSVDGRVAQISQLLEPLIWEKDAFIDRAPWHEADDAMRELTALLGALPAEHELI